MSSSRIERKLAAIMFTDIAGYTESMSKSESKTLNLLEKAPFLETAYNQIQEKADNLEPDVRTKFLSYLIPKAIVKEWEKVK